MAKLNKKRTNYTCNNVKLLISEILIKIYTEEKIDYSFLISLRDTWYVIWAVLSSALIQQKSEVHTVLLLLNYNSEEL